MTPKCIQAVNAAAGKVLSPAKLKAIEDNIGAKMRELARRDRQRWQSLTRDQRMIEAATEAAHDIVSQATLKETRATLQILKTAETEARIAGHQGLSKLTRTQGWIRDMEITGTMVDAERNQVIGHLTDMLDAVEVKDGAGFWRRAGMAIFDLDNPVQTRDVVREIFAGADGHTGNALAKAGAKAWLETIEAMRLRFNGAGGDVGKLGYGYLGQHHDRLKIARTNAGQWADDVLPLLDREQYVEADGTLTPPDKLREMLVAAHETLATGGDNKRAPGAFAGSGAKANKGAAQRVLHFRDGDAWSSYMAQYGEGSLYDAMMGHIGAMTRDTVLIEQYGPNAEMQARLQADLAERADKNGGMGDRRSFGTTAASRWDILSGKTSAPLEPTLAWAGDLMRNVQTAAKLGGAVISSLTDIDSVAKMLHFNRLSYFEYLGSLRGQMDEQTRRELQAHGIIGEALGDALNRWTGDNLTHSLSGRMSGATMKLSLTNAWSDGLRRAFSMTLMQGFARKLGKAWGQLDEWDQYLLQRKGIGESEWSVISAAQATDVNGHMLLTPAGIKATGHADAVQIAGKWGAFVSDEAQFAVINPDQAVRAIATGGGMQRGTISGEAVRCMMQFKSFPAAMISRHWRRIFETPQGLQGAPAGFGATTTRGATFNRVAMLAAGSVTLMMLGAIVTQINALRSGKDAMNMDPSEEHGQKFWIKAMAQGGGLSFVADALLADPADGNTRTWENKLGLLGPVAGALGGLADVGPENVRQWLQGKDAHLGPEALRWINSQLPGVSLWQVRLLWQREVIDQFQEMMNPGYLGRMRQRAVKDWGASWWWAPGDQTPDRAPDIGKAVGQ